MINIDNERIKKYLGSVEERINFNKENGCKLLDCKVIDENIKLRQENIKLKKIAEKLAEDKIIPKCKNCSDEDTHECTECALDWARNEVLKDE